MNYVKYAGFWVRVVASIIDSILIMIVSLPMTYGNDSSYTRFLDLAYYGSWDSFVDWILPAIVVIYFWITKSATPGKMVFHIKIIDAKTGEKPSNQQFLIRYLGYFVSTIPLMLGFIWVAFDDRKQGWHDKMAGTVSIIK